MLLRCKLYPVLLISYVIYNNTLSRTNHDDKIKIYIDDR